MPINPSDQEEEYIKLQEIHRLRKQRREQAQKAVEEERKRLKELHWMRCPKCGMELDEIEFRGVKVDVCLSCEGMFLDKGELGKIQEYKEAGLFDRLVSAVFYPSKPSD